MKLFDIFKKKKSESTFPENELEKSLIKASKNISARNDFYMKLLWNDLIILTNGEDDFQEGTRIIEEDTTVQFTIFENGQIPIFTSSNRIFDKGVIKEQVKFMAMKGQDLFGLAKGATFVLNPYSPYGKELLPQEINNLLNGSIFEQNNELTIDKETEVQIGQPEKFPKELVKALTILFKTQDNVKAAYLAIIKIVESEKLPHFIIGLDINGEISEITNKAIPITEQYLGKDEVIDFMEIDNKGGGVSEYFTKKSKPFYIKR